MQQYIFTRVSNYTVAMSVSCFITLVGEVWWQSENISRRIISHGPNAKWCNFSLYDFAVEQTTEAFVNSSGPI